MSNFNFPHVSRETSDRLAIWAKLIDRWSSTVPLLSRRERNARLDEHIADSLSLIRFLGAQSPTADFGSGAGFPGLALAIATGREFTLIESHRRKAAFLLEAARLTGAPVRVYSGRIEDLTDHFELMTARAVAPLTTLLSLVAPRLTGTGRCLFLKGPRLSQELLEARERWSFDAETYAGHIETRSTILSVSNLRRMQVS